MSYLNSPGQTFRMPDSWYEPPMEPDYAECPECDGTGDIGCEDDPEVCPKCEGEGEVAVDPQEAYEDYLSDRADAIRKGEW